MKTLEVSDRQSLINAEDSKGRTPLVVSVIHGHIDCVSLVSTVVSQMMNGMVCIIVAVIWC